MQSIPALGSMLLDRYYIEKILDQHNDTAIIKTLDTRLDVPAVLKLLLTDPDSPEWESKKQNFVQSFRTQARLNHPNIVHVSNIETKGNLVFSVMELLDGQTLDNHILSNECETKEILEIFLGVVDAVAMGHSSDVTHLNVSPKNIVMNHQGNRLCPRLLNFAYVRKPEEYETEGSLPFVAPEQLTKDGKTSQATDVFSICASLYFAFAKTPLLSRNSIQEYIDFYQSFETYGAFSDKIPQDFVEILTKGLKVSPEERYTSANELLKALKIIGKNYHLSANLTLDATKSSTEGSSAPSQPIVRTPSQSLYTPSKSRSQQLVAPKFPSQPSAPPPPPRTPSPSQSIPAPSKSVSQQLMAPSFLISNHGITLPPSIQHTYNIIRIDSVLDHAFVCAVCPKENPTLTFSLKALRNHQLDEITIFNDAVQKSASLAQQYPAFQNIVMAVPDGALIANDIPRQSLPAYIQTKGVLPIPNALQLAIFIAQAMDFAHQHGYINGNLKPTNIIFENRNNVLTPIIYDFGQKLYVDSAIRLTYTDIPFIAPEIDYNLKHSNVQSDIFSFGMTFVYMLIGAIPYKSKTREELIGELDSIDAVPDFTQYRPDIPQDLASVIRWCISFEPSGRYASFSRLLQDLYYLYNQMIAPK